MDVSQTVIPKVTYVVKEHIPLDALEGIGSFMAAQTQSVSMLLAEQERFFNLVFSFAGIAGSIFLVIIGFMAAYWRNILRRELRAQCASEVVKYLDENHETHVKKTFKEQAPDMIKAAILKDYPDVAEKHPQKKDVSGDVSPVGSDVCYDKGEDKGKEEGKDDVSTKN